MYARCRCIDSASRLPALRAHCSNALGSGCQIRTLSHYDRLGVAKTATQQEIKRAFYEKSKQLHPDASNVSEAQRAQATQAFVELKTAYDTLRRPADRKAYDFGERMQERRRSAGPSGGYYHNSYYQQHHYSYDDTWRPFGEQGFGGKRSADADHAKRSAEMWRTIWRWTALGAFIVTFYNLGYAYQIYNRERKLARLVDKDEIAKSFLRQPEFKDVKHDKSEVNNLAQILKDDIDDAWRRRLEEIREKNRDEIREEYRWLRAVQDVDHNRRARERRAALDTRQRGPESTESVNLTPRDS